MVHPDRANQRVRTLDDAPTLSDDQKEVVRAHHRRTDELLASEHRAKYKIEIFFTKKRRLHAPSPGLLSIWESATSFHGGGDVKIYWCPGLERRQSDCEAVIPAHANGYGFLHCPSCKCVWRGEDVLGELLGNFPARIWAEHLVRFFVRLGHNADIYLKAPKDDLREATRLEQARELRGERLQRVRRERVLTIYPLKHIVQDTANGGDLFRRFLGFLQS
ncbi:hypothetical protein LVJ94_35305 [Pendulispora rubella]|uniref:Zinc finger CHC2-type domain-containing protein n=1 Tax=Pendulispora rubella TaxID=2741070 RepID=A0ABZ2KYU2_9BACT